jgi:hypothetical protein
MQAPGTEVEHLRDEIRGVLARSSAWQSLPDDRRRKLATDLLEVTDFLQRPLPVVQAANAQPLEATEDLKQRLATGPALVGQDFRAGAMAQGVEEFGNLVQTVDFPEFVSGLIQGVFQAIVNASIQQMEAYGELLAATAKSVEQFAQDHVADGQARENIVSRFPNLVRIADGRLVAREGADDLSPLQAIAGNDGSVDLSDPESEARLLSAVKIDLARQRQKMMALMVMLGINRIVVTNGRINAKVVFDIETNDYAKRMASAGMVDRREDEKGAGGGFHTPWGGAAAYSKSRHKTTVRSSVDETSEASAQMKAQLTGDVRVNFKSETLPPERMLDALQMDQMSSLAGGSRAPAPASAPGGAPPPANQPPPPAAEAPPGAR